MGKSSVDDDEESLTGLGRKPIKHIETGCRCRLTNPRIYMRGSVLSVGTIPSHFENPVPIPSRPVPRDKRDGTGH